MHILNGELFRDFRSDEAVVSDLYRVTARENGEARDIPAGVKHERQGVQTSHGEASKADPNWELKHNLKKMRQGKNEN